MMGTVNGEAKQIITNVSVTMSIHFCTIMGILYSEAKAGAFTTKGDAVHRRDEILNNRAGAATAPATPAGAVASQADTADSQGGIDVD